MKKNLIIIFLFLSFCFGIANFCFAENSTALKANPGFGESLEKTAAGTGHASAKFFTKDNLPEAIGKIIQIALSFLGIIFLILMIYGGYIWMVARGNDEEVNKAKDIIRNALIGLMLVFGAYVITQTVVSFYSDANSTGASEYDNSINL